MCAFPDFARSSTSVVHACLEMQIEMKQTEYREILNRKWKSSGDTCFFPIFFQSFHLLFGSRHSDVNKIWTTNERICCAIFLVDTCIYTSLHGIFHQFHLPRFFSMERLRFLIRTTDNSFIFLLFFVPFPLFFRFTPFRLDSPRSRIEFLV